MYKQFFSLVERRGLNFPLTASHVNKDMGSEEPDEPGVPITAAEVALDETIDDKEVEEGILIPTPVKPLDTSRASMASPSPPTSPITSPPTSPTSPTLVTNSSSPSQAGSGFFMSAGHQGIDPRHSIPNHTEQIEIVATNVIIGVVGVLALDLHVIYSSLIQGDPKDGW